MDREEIDEDGLQRSSKVGFPPGKFRAVAAATNPNREGRRVSGLSKERQIWFEQAAGELRQLFAARTEVDVRDREGGDRLQYVRYSLFSFATETSSEWKGNA